MAALFPTALPIGEPRCGIAFASLSKGLDSLAPVPC